MKFTNKHGNVFFCEYGIYLSKMIMNFDRNIIFV